MTVSPTATRGAHVPRQSTTERAQTTREPGGAPVRRRATGNGRTTRVEGAHLADAGVGVTEACEALGRAEEQIRAVRGVLARAVAVGAVAVPRGRRRGGGAA